MVITIETIRNNRRITIKRIRAQFTRVLPCKVWIAYHQEQSNQGPNSRAPQQSMLICVGGARPTATQWGILPPQKCHH